MTTDLCGWFGRFDEASEAVLHRMAGAAPERQLRTHAGSAAGIYVDAGYEGADLFVDQRFKAGVLGRPRWSDPELASLAARSGDAAALATAYRKYKTELFQFLQGPFAIALHDEAESESLLAIDRFGVHTMNYTVSTDPLVFASTADGVRRHPRVASTIDPQAIFNFLSFSVVPAPGTIYREQRKLLPAQYLHCRKGEARLGFYWQVPYRETAKQPDSLAEELHVLLRQAMRRAVEGRDIGGVGAFLSGGLDSSTVAGLLAGLSTTPAKSFTMYFGAEGYDEALYARKAVEHFALQAREHTLTPDEALALLPTLARDYDEPFANSSAIPAYYCARMARENGVGLLLAGDGGDELFAGNSRYATQLLLDRYFRVPASLRKGLIEPIVDAMPKALLLGPVRKIHKYVRLATTPMPDRMLAYEHLSEAEARAMFDSAVLREIDIHQPLAVAREVYNRPKAASMLARMLHLDLQLAIADNDLRKVRRMCRIAGVEVRFPFLDEDLAVFSAQIPADVLMKGGRLRAFYKDAMRGFLPQEILEKSKHGFGMPYDLWIKTNPGIRQLMTDCVASFRKRRYCNAGFIDALLTSADGGDPRSIGRLWDIMMLELWLRERGLN